MQNDYDTCCVFQETALQETEELKKHVYDIMEVLVLFRNVDTFLLCENNEFGVLCGKLLDLIKQTYPHVRYEFIKADCREDVYRGIDSSLFLLLYYDGSYESVADTPLEYAIVRGKSISCFP
ncbi:MAG: hypothetical protein J6Q42_02840 [Clostridia bacterium]|nr:hypothetical protein [Clostridia bacterium]